MNLAVGRSAVAGRWSQVLRPAAFHAMYLLYLDDSGSVANPSDRHIVLAGLAVFERQAHWLSRKMDSLAAEIWPDSPKSIEFRGTDIRGGRRHWRGIPRNSRIDAYHDALRIVASSIPGSVVLFGAAIDKAALSPDDPMEYAFEQICNRFDRYLGRLHKLGNTQRGLITLDKSSYETSLQGLALDFTAEGHRWGKIYNMADVPLFVDSGATRMIQFADLIAHAVRLYYEHGDAKFFNTVSRRFDAVGGVLHGLVHYAPPGGGCDCPACR